MVVAHPFMGFLRRAGVFMLVTGILVSCQSPDRSGPDPSGVDPIMEIDFDGYSNTASLLADCTTFNCVEDVSTGDMALDATVAPPGASKSMRYEYRHDGNGCNSITLKRAFLFPEVEQEVWAEFKVLWSTNFTTANNACPPNDHKLIFGDTEADQSGRWAFYVGGDSPPNHTVQQERPVPNGGGAYLNQSNIPSAEDLWTSGTWHTIRLHIKHSTSGSSGDGIWEIWIDGVLRHRQTNFSTNDGGGGSDRIKGFSFAHNKDDGPPNVDMFIWWGPVKVYNTNPGW